MVDRNLSLSHVHHQPAGGPIHGHKHRRQLLTGVAAATALAAVPVAAQAAPEPHHAWAAEAARLRALGYALSAADDDDGASDAWTAAWDVDQRILAEPARSLPALVEQLKAAEFSLSQGVGLDDEGMLRGIREAAERLAGRG